MTQEHIAHVKKKNDVWQKPHLLLEHLAGTAELAERFAAKFSSASWGRALGYCHDAGKSLPEWQDYLKQQSGYGHDDAHLENQLGKMQHAIQGAKLAEHLYGKHFGRLLAYCIAGHHARLPDWSSAEGSARSSLQFRMQQCDNWAEILRDLQDAAKNYRPNQPPWRFDNDIDLSLWIRMLFSCLADADFLDTEAYMNPERSVQRSGHLSLSKYLEIFNRYMMNLEENAENTVVNETRRLVRLKCSQVGRQPQGVFSLTVPTGGGKTLSSLAFALEHAARHNLDRIIYVIPFTSIVEQNADVFRKIYGDSHITEHHSNIGDGEATPKNRIASENWDAPLIITTAVQFLESLFAAKPGRCRKLHNICNSVVIFDEAQLIPLNYLEPTLKTLQLLVDHYGVTIVLCTATQPAFEKEYILDRCFPALRDIKEIMGGEVEVMFEKLKRVEVNLPPDLNAPVEWSELAKNLKQHKQVLCIVSDRKSCRELHGLMPKDTYHLSSLMCGQHRSEHIAKIKQGLLNGETVRVISTQLVEAGVDFDFPVVYRAFAGLDSLAQAAGRCNREGCLIGLGKLVVFVPPRKAPPGYLRKVAETSFNILSEDRHDPLHVNKLKSYFIELYWKLNSLDSEKIVDLLTPESRSELSIFFRTAANKFKIIDDSMQKTVLVSYKKGANLISALKKLGPERKLMRKLQRYAVNIYNHEFAQLLNGGSAHRSLLSALQNW